MDSPEELEDEYVRARAADILQVWSSCPISSSISTSTSTSSSRNTVSFSEWMSTTFLPRLSSMLLEETSTTVSLFGKDRSPILLSLLLESSMSPLAASLASHLFALASPSLAVSLFLSLDATVTPLLPQLCGCDAKRLSLVLSAVFAGFVVYMEKYADIEGEHLRECCKELVAPVSFDDIASSSTASLSAFDSFSSSSLSFADPVEVYCGYAERLLLAVDALLSPARALMMRGCRLMGGLKIKAVVKAAATALMNCVKLLIVKMDDLRVACGYPPDRSSTGLVHSSSSSLSADTATTPLEDSSTATTATPSSSSTTSAGSASATTSSSIVQSWARKLESADLGGRELVPAALRSLQAAGRLSRRMRQLDVLAMDLVNDLSSILLRDGAAAVAGGGSMGIGMNGVGGGAAGTGGGMSSTGLSSLSSLSLPSSTSWSSTSSSEREPQFPPLSMSTPASIFACHLLHSNPAQALELKSFLSSFSSRHTSHTVFSSLSPSLARFKSSAGALLFDLCTSAPEKMMGELAGEDDVWRSAGAGAALRDDFASDNLLPQATITQVIKSFLCDLNVFLFNFAFLFFIVCFEVGEHLLSLVQELETFASSDALTDLLYLAGESSLLAVGSRGWRQLKDIIDAKDVSGLVSIFLGIICQIFFNFTLRGFCLFLTISLCHSFRTMEWINCAEDRRV